MVSKAGVKWVMRQRMGVADWEPAFGSAAAGEVLAECGSGLEVAYALGVAYYLEKVGGHRVGLEACSLEFQGGRCPGLWFVECWHGWPGGQGPSGMVFVPQLVLNGLRRDFGVFYCVENGSVAGSVLQFLVEVDGYMVHRGRRGADERRDAGLRCRECGC